MSIQPFVSSNISHSFQTSIHHLVVNSSLPVNSSDTLDCSNIIEVIPKTLPEVVGEKILRPVIDKALCLSNLATHVFQNMYSYLNIAKFSFPGAHAYEYEDQSSFVNSLDYMQGSYDYSDPKVNNYRFKQLLSLESFHHQDQIIPILEKNAVTTEGYNFIHYVIKNGSAEKIINLITAPFFNTKYLNTVNHLGYAPLHTIAARNFLDLEEHIDLFLNQQSMQDHFGFTPIHHAMHYDNRDFLDLMNKYHLLSPRACTYNGHIHATPLQVAVAAGHPDILDTLIQKRVVDLNTNPFSEKNTQIGTVLHIAIENRQFTMLNHLLKKYSEEVKPILEMTHKGLTPLQMAASLGQISGVQILIDRKARINAKGDVQQTSFFLAVQNLHIDVMELLGSVLHIDIREGNEKITPLGWLENRLNDPKCDKERVLETIRVYKRIQAQIEGKIIKPPKYLESPPKNVVWAGGGVCGSAYIPIIEVAEKEGLFANVENFGGTSVGSITSALLATGYKADKIKVLLNEDFKQFLDYEENVLVNKDLHKKLEAMLKSKTSVEEKRSWFNSLPNGVQKLIGFFGSIHTHWETVSELGSIASCANDDNCSDLFMQIETFFTKRLDSEMGFCKGESLRLWIEKLIYQSTGIEYCTFEELHTLASKDPVKYKNIVVFAVKANAQRELVQFSYADPKKHKNNPNKYPKPLWNNLIISDAIRASSSLPLIFNPHTLHFKNAAGHRYPDNSTGIFVDGGMIKNYPIEAFDEMYHQPDVDSWGVMTNKETLGIRLSYAENPHTAREKIHNIKDLILEIAKTYYDVEYLLQKQRSDFSGRTVIVNLPEGSSSSDFNMSSEQKQRIYESGLNSIKEWMKIQAQESSKKQKKQIKDDTQKAKQEILNLYKILNPSIGKQEQKEDTIIATRKLLKIKRENLGEKDSETINAYNQLIKLFQESGMQEDMLIVAKETLPLRRDALGEVHPQTIHVYNQVIQILEKLDRKEEVLKISLETLEIRRKTLSEKNPETLNAYNKVIQILEKLDRKEEVLKISLETLEIRRKTLGEKDPETLNAYNKVIQILEKLDRKKDLLKILNETLLIRKKGLGEEDPQTLSTYNKIIQILEKGGEKKELLKILNELLIIEKTSLGEKDSKTLEVYNKIIQLLRDLEKEEDALQKAEEALAIRRNVLGEKHPETVKVYNHVMQILEKLGRRKDILDLIQKTLILRKDILGEKDAKTLEVHNQLIEMLEKSGKKEDALEEAKKALHIRRKVLGEKENETLKAYNKSIQILENLGRKEAIIELAEEALIERKNILGEKDPLTLATYDKIIQTLEDLGRKEEALDWLNKALTIRRKLLGEKNQPTLSVYNKIIQILENLGRKEEVLKVTQETHTQRITALGEKDPLTLAVCDKIIQTLEDLGRKEEALEFAKKALIIRRSFLGEKDPYTVNIYKKIIQVLDKLGKPDDTLIFIKENLEIRKNSLTTQDQYTIDAYNQIIQILENLGKNEEALSFVLELLEIKKEFLGKVDLQVLKLSEKALIMLKNLGHMVKAIELEKEILQMKESMKKK